VKMKMTAWNSYHPRLLISELEAKRKRRRKIKGNKKKKRKKRENEQKKGAESMDRGGGRDLKKSENLPLGTHRKVRS